MPLFSPTNTLPSGAKAMAVGRVSPPNTRLSTNPLGTAAAAAGDVGAVDLVALPRTSPPSPDRVGNVDAPACPGTTWVTSAAPSTIAAALISPRLRMATPIRCMATPQRSSPSRGGAAPPALRIVLARQAERDGTRRTYSLRPLTIVAITSG